MNYDPKPAADTLGLGALVDRVAALARAAGPRTLPLPSELDAPAHGFYCVDGDNRVAWVDLPPPRQATLLHDVASFVAYALAVHAGKIGPPPNTMYALAGGADVSLCCAPHAHPANGARLPLCHTAEFASLTQLATPRSPADLARLIRDTLRDAIDEPAGLLTIVRNLKFAGQTERETSLTHTSAAIATSVKQAVTSQAAIPEIVTMHVRPFDVSDLRKRYPVRCSLDVDFDKGALRLKPLDGDLADVRDAALADLRELLAPLPCPLFSGSLD